ncbi:hypothetical protein TI39_contig260g00003 [Zymoseptoria brevis]|uniref:BTB domain-containing protein n=1 Tax=Zymoseptoria brevis TaxID=1047168 RepID=A0A0F4GYI3_9PEZI|nr:hypothetical protein TI39_contig260g00003 [Zymoseptoria brevis]
MSTEAMDTAPDIPTESIPDEKIIDDGDLLINCCDKSGGKFLVSTAVIKRASPVFKAMLGLRFREGQLKTLPLEVECPEDHWAGMRLMLQLLHNCASCVDGEMPTFAALECFAFMAILADKYQCIEPLSLQVDGVLSNASSLRLTDRNNFNKLYCLAVAAYVLKKPKHFYVFTKRLVLEQTKQFHNLHERFVPGIGDVLGFRFIFELETQRTAAILFVSEGVRDMAKAWCVKKGSYKTGVCIEAGHSTFHKSNECQL